MKAKYLLTVFILTLTFISCSTEEALVTDTGDVNLEMTLDNNSEMVDSGITQTIADPKTNPQNGGNRSLCNGTAPVAPFGTSGVTFIIHYDPSSHNNDPEEVNCTRMEYMGMFCGLKMTLIQSQDPWVDSWVLTQDLSCGGGGGMPTKQDVDTTVDGDPRLCIPGLDC